MPDVAAQLAERMREAGAAGLRLPPPVFTEMEGEFLAFDAEAGTLRVRFPVRERYQNPTGVMHGGALAMAIDNTIGPLSYLVAPPSATTELGVTYLRPVLPAFAFIEVEARLVQQAGRQLVFDAAVTAPDGTPLALARATSQIMSRIPSQTASTS